MMSSGMPLMRSPRTWGWTACGSLWKSDSSAFPTHVGMDRQLKVAGRGGDGVPHARGDGPGWVITDGRTHTRSPRTWGWTGLATWPVGTHRAFPTHVGMDRRGMGRAPPRARVPHARGDGPLICLVLIGLTARSPRTWGWTAIEKLPRIAPFAFPTHVGMDRPLLYGQ